MKDLYITEKPSVAFEFASTLGIKGNKRDGFIESADSVVTWCIGHLVTMSYPEEYDEKYKKWRLETLPFLPEKYKYEVIKTVKKQFDIIKSLLERDDISTIYVCTDSGREGEYIYRLVDQMTDTSTKIKKRVWIDSQTEEEIKKGVKNAKPLAEYDRLSEAAYLRAKEDYLMGINFSRLLTLSYGRAVSKRLGEKFIVIAVGRVMTCVLGMIVKREIEIRDFVKTPYYKISAKLQGKSADFSAEWKAVEGSDYYMSPLLFKDVGFMKEKDAKVLVNDLSQPDKTGNIPQAIISDIKKKKETKNPPLLFNLAELQNELSKRLKINPDETLKIAQSLYEKKMITYPRTDARVLSKAVAKEIEKNIRGLTSLSRIENKEALKLSDAAGKVLSGDSFTKLEKTKYVNDKAITDHFAIIPTGQGLNSISKLKPIELEVFLMIASRFLAIFYPPAIFSQLSITAMIKNEAFYSSEKVCLQSGYLELVNEEKNDKSENNSSLDELKKLKKGDVLDVKGLEIKQSETTPPKRYSSGSIILAMESAGKLIEDDELREQIKGSGIGTSATRAEILKKLQKIDYIALNNKTQILTPTKLGEEIYNVVSRSIPSLLRPELTASWEKGLGMIEKGEIEPSEYMHKLEGYIKKNTKNVMDNTKRAI